MVNQHLFRESYDPQWTEVEYRRVGGRDFLGVETLSEGILADLLPGINNQTRRARYYSFWAWVLHDFIHDPDAPHTQAGFYEWLRSREAVLILANLFHSCSTGAAGTDQGSQIWQNGELASYPLNWKSLLSVDGGSYELYYRGALQEMNIVQQTENSPHDNLTRTVGLGLAEAYTESVAQTTYIQKYLDATRLRKAEIEDFAHYGCLCQVKDHEAERQRLIDAFFRFDTPDSYAVRRLASLCFFLDVIGQSEGRPLNQEAFRTVLYFWAYGSKHPYQPKGNLLYPAQRWRIFQLRQYFVYFIQSFWTLFLNRVGIEALSAGEYLAWLLQELDLAALVDKYHFDLPDTDAQRLPLQCLYKAVRDALPDGALDPGIVALQTKLNERALTSHIRSKRTSLDAQTLAGDALLGLVLIYWRSQPWCDQPGWHYASERYAAGRHPIAGYLRHVDRAFEENWTLAEWLGWFHQRYLWLQHRRVALEKLIAGGVDRAMFELIQDESPDFLDYQHSLDSARFRAIGTDEPKMNGPRFPSALNIMTDLGLIKPVQNSGYQLCPDGAALLERFRAYEIPGSTEA